MWSCDLWEFNAMVHGYKMKHGIRSGGDMSEDRLRELGIAGFD